MIGLLKIKHKWLKGGLLLLLMLWVFRKAVKQTTGIDMETITGKLPRGIRNNNPLNIIRTNDKWKGMSDKQTDSRFIVFNEMKWGTRAAIKLIRNIMNKYNYQTLFDLINHWAPVTDGNNPVSYANRVAGYINSALGTELNRDTIIIGDIQDPESLVTLAWSMSQVENGTKHIVPISEFWKGYDLI